jgi:hypothetical protein
MVNKPDEIMLSGLFVGDDNIVGVLLATRAALDMLARRWRGGAREGMHLAKQQRV